MPKRKVREELRFQLPKLPDIRTMPRLPVVPRGPRVLRTELNPPQVFESNAPPPMPPDFNGTSPEWRAYWWLIKEGFQPDFQSSLMGGRAALGGMVVDIILHEMAPPLALRVQGLAFHYQGFRGDIGKDERQRMILESEFGMKVIDLDEDDLNERLDYIMRKAVYEGIDLSRGMWQR